MVTLLLKQFLTCNTQHQMKLVQHNIAERNVYQRLECAWKNVLHWTFDNILSGPCQVLRIKILVLWYITSKSFKRLQDNLTKTHKRRKVLKAHGILFLLLESRNIWGVPKLLTNCFNGIDSSASISVWVPSVLFITHREPVGRCLRRRLTKAVLHRNCPPPKKTNLAVLLLKLISGQIL